MEFHGTRSARISMTRAIPWNSMEFHGITSAPISMTRAVPWNSMELRMRQFRWHEQFHGIPWNSMEFEVRQFRWHEKFHGIPWNLRCANFAYTSSSMEFHGTWSAPILRPREVPWKTPGFFTARILSTRHARRDAWMVTQGVVGNSWAGLSTEPPLPSGIATHWVVDDSNQPVAAITGMRVVNSAVPRVHLSPHLSSSSQSIN